jgi:ligand-binding sensor domain-containing protein
MLIIAAAVFGAALGLFLRNAVLALVIALAATASAQIGAMVMAHALAADPAQAILVAALHDAAGDGLMALIPNLAAAGFGAIIATGMMAMSLRDRQGSFWLPDAHGRGRGKDRRHKIRYAQAIEERPKQIAAESRIDRLLKQ